MKTLGLPFTCFLLIALQVACSSNEKGETPEGELLSEEATAENGDIAKLLEALKQSRKHWKQFKELNDDTYAYRVSWSHPLSDHLIDVLVSVKMGSVVERQLKKGQTTWNGEFWSNTLDPSTPISAIESGSELGSNKEINDLVGTPKTIDDLYSICELDILNRASSETWISLGFFSNGILSTCLYEKCGLADAFGNGVELDTLAPGLQPTLPNGYQPRSETSYFLNPCD